MNYFEYISTLFSVSKGYRHVLSSESIKFIYHTRMHGTNFTTAWKAFDILSNKQLYLINESGGHFCNHLE